MISCQQISGSRCAGCMRSIPAPTSLTRVYFLRSHEETAREGGRWPIRISLHAFQVAEQILVFLDHLHLSLHFLRIGQFAPHHHYLLNLLIPKCHVLLLFPKFECLISASHLIVEAACPYLFPQLLLISPVFFLSGSVLLFFLISGGFELQLIH